MKIHKDNTVGFEQQKNGVWNEWKISGNFVKTKRENWENFTKERTRESGRESMKSS